MLASDTDASAPGDRQPFQPSSAGTVRDLRERTNLAQAISFFGSRAEAARFVDVCLAQALPTLPDAPDCVDFGGGQGILAQVLSETLFAAGRRPRVTVVDSNPSYLADARERGLTVQLANIESCELRGVDLATMRLVNHYCGHEQQRAMLANIHDALRPGGIFVSQIETGSPDICRLQGKISNALSNERRAGYYWPTLDEYFALAHAAGFVETRVIGESPPVESTVNEALATAWKRFHGSRVEALARDARLDELDRLLAERAHFFRESHLLIAQEWERGTGSPQTTPAQGSFQLRYPIVHCTRSA